MFKNVVPFLFLFLVTPCIAGDLSGTVRDPEGQPLAGINIFLLETETLCSLGSASSDNDGSYEIPSVPNGNYYVQIFGNGYLFRYFGNDSELDIASATLVQVGANTTQDLVAYPGGTISGQVSINGGSLEDALVVLVDPVSLFNVFSFSGFPEYDDATGNYAISGLEPGCYLVGLVYDPQSTGTSGPVTYYNGAGTPENATLVSVSAGQTVSGIDLNFTPGDTGTLAVTLNGATQQSFPVLEAFNGQSSFFSAPLSTQGVTQIALPPGTYTLGVHFANSFLDFQDPTPRTITAGQTTSVTYNASPGGTIAGQIAFGFEQVPFSGLVDVIDASSGFEVATRGFNTSGTSPVSYSVNGLPDGDYLVRVTGVDELGVGALFSASVQQEYYNGAATPNQAQTVSISGANTVNNVNFGLKRGGTIQGQVQLNGQPLAAFFALVNAIEVDSGQIFNGLYVGAPLNGYIIQNLPPGNYKVGMNTGLFNQSQFSFSFLSLLSLPLLGCANVGPSFHGGQTLETATVFNLPAGGQALNKNITLQPGGGITGRILSDDCSCPVQTGLIAAYQGDVLKRVGFVSGGGFEIAGLPAGQYTLRFSKFFGDVAVDIAGASFELDEFEFSDIFSPENAVIFEQSTAVQAGQYTSIGDWCSALQVTGGGEEEIEVAAELVYSWISNREGDFESILIANNYSDDSIRVRLTATRENGEPEIVYRNIPARGFLEEQASSLFPGLGSGPGYTVRLASPTERITGSWVTNNLQAASGESPSQGIAVRVPESGQDPGERVGERIIFGYLPISEDLISAPVITNVSDADTDVTLQFFSEDGTLISTEVIGGMEPNRPFARVANSLVGEGTGDVYMIAQSSSGPITGVSFVFNQAFGETAIGNVTRIATGGADQGATTLMYPWVSNNAGSFESIVVANNYGDQAVEVTLTARRNTNPVQSQTVTRMIPAHGFLNELASSLFNQLGSGPGYAVELASPSSRINGQWVTNNLIAASGQSPSQGVAVRVPGGGGSRSDRAGENLMFGFLPVTGSFTSAPVVVNLGDGPANVTLRFYNGSGNLVLTDTTTLTGIAPGIPFASLANALLPNTGANVYMVASSDGEPITGVTFVFNGAFNEPAIGNATAIDFEP